MPPGKFESGKRGVMGANVQTVATRLNREDWLRGVSPSASNRKAREAAMLLVLIAVAMSTILALTFLSAQSTSIGIAQNVRDHARARAIAESGLSE